MRTPIWSQKDRMKIPISEMSDTHIVNTHRMLCRYLRNFIHDEGEWPESQTLESSMAFGGYQWVKMFEAECERRGLATIAEYPNIDFQLLEPVYGGVGALTTMSDECLLEFQASLERAGANVLDMMRGSGPQGDAAQDAFDREFQESMEWEVNASDMLPIINGEINRRGLESECECHAED